MQFLGAVSLALFLLAIIAVDQIALDGKLLALAVVLGLAASMLALFFQFARFLGLA